MGPQGQRLELPRLLGDIEAEAELEYRDPVGPQGGKSEVGYGDPTGRRLRGQR